MECACAGREMAYSAADIAAQSAQAHTEVGSFAGHVVVGAA